MKPIIIAAVLGALTLTGCGKQIELQRPGPLYGPVARADASANANKPSAPGSVKENQDPASSSATTRQSRIPGTNPDPFSGPSGPGFPNSGPGR
ncbi:MAG: hypothetical protein WCP82_04515 [Alphaproteobacteria bacterium]